MKKCLLFYYMRHEKAIKILSAISYPVLLKSLTQLMLLFLCNNEMKWTFFSSSSKIKMDTEL